MCSRRLKQAPFGRTYGPKIRCIDPLDGCACMITSRMLNALRYLTHLCLYEQRTHRKNTEDGCAFMFKGCDKLNELAHYYYIYKKSNQGTM